MSLVDLLGPGTPDRSVPALAGTVCFSPGPEYCLLPLESSELLAFSVGPSLGKLAVEFRWRLGVS